MENQKEITKEEIQKMRNEHLRAMKNLRNKAYYENKRKEQKAFCQTCLCYVDKYQYFNHIASNKHGKNLAIVEEIKNGKKD